MRRLQVCTVLLAPFLAQAQQATPVWPEEPNSIFGLTLGKKVTELSGLVRCPQVPVMPGGRLTMPDYNFKGGICYEDERYLGIGNIKVWGTPDLGVSYNTELVIRNGELHGAVLTLSSSNVKHFFDVLVTRYGKPAKSDLKTYQNRFGAKYEGRVHTWIGPNVFMSFSEVGGKVDTAEFLMATQTYIESRKPKVDPATAKDRL